MVAAGYAIFGEDYLPELVAAGAEAACAGEEIVAPHAVEALSILLSKFWPCGFKIVIPDHERLIVIGSKVMPILHHEVPFKGAPNLRDRGDFPSGEDVAVNPGVSVVLCDSSANCVKEKEPSLREHARHSIKKCPIIFLPHMLKHTD